MTATSQPTDLAQPEVVIRERTAMGKQPRLWEVRLLLAEIDRLRDELAAADKEISEVDRW